MKTGFAQTSFVSGEISPRLWGRPDADIYRSGLKTMVNTLPRAHGPAERRGGFEFILKRTAEAARVFNFQINAALAYIAAIVPGTLEIIQATGLRETDNVVLNSSFTGGATSWTSVTAAGGTTSFNATLGTASLVVTGAGASQSEIRQAVTVVAGSTYLFTVDRPAALVYRNIQVAVGTSAGGAQIATFVNNIRQFQATIVIPPLTTTVHITIRLVGGGTAGLVTLNSVGFYLDTGLAITFSVPYTAGDLRQVRFEQPPGHFAAYLVHPRYPPQELTYDVATDVWALAPVPFVGPPVEWATGNYPSTVAFFQGRSFWGGTPNEPETITASKSGSLEDLTPGSTDSDGFAVTLSKKGAIRWLASVKNLLVGTDSGEHILTSEGGVLKAGDVQVEQQSAFGSSPIPAAAQIGNSIAYITGDRRKLRLSGYRWEESQWVSTDISFASEHITSGLVNSLAWAGTPENVVLMSDNRGHMIACTYEPTLKIVGWSRHVGWATMYDFTSQSIDGVQTIWLARRVTDPGGGATQVYFERYDPNIFMDSYKVTISAGPTTVITGLGHLEGQVVQVLTDGAVHPDRTVVGGQITLQRQSTVTYVGKQFTSTMRLLSWDDKLKTVGTTMGMKKRAGKVWARLLTSGLPEIDGRLPPDRTPSTPMDTSEPLTTSDVEVVSLGWAQQEEITLEQPLPKPLFVLAVFGELMVGGN
jgi:hypothetical protein